MEKIKLVVPTINHQEAALAYIQEFRDYDSPVHGSGSLDSYVLKYDEWLEKLANNLDEQKLEPGRVLSSTYFAIRENDQKIVGMINIRHQLNDYLLREGGHIGYAVRPTERRKGYATEILYLGLEKCFELGIEKVLVVCDKSNLGSVKTIQSNDGVFENEVIETDTGELMERYCIRPSEVLGKKSEITKLR